MLWEELSLSLCLEPVSDSFLWRFPVLVLEMTMSVTS